MAWQDDYKAVVVAYVTERGKPQADRALGDDPEPWDNGEPGYARVQEIRAHLASCGIDITRCSMLEDTNWTEWGGTFGDDTFVTGYRIRVTCRCGTVADRGFRLTSESLAKLVNDLASYQIEGGLHH